MVLVPQGAVPVLRCGRWDWRRGMAEITFFVWSLGESKYQAVERGAGRLFSAQGW